MSVLKAPGNASLPEHREQHLRERQQEACCIELKRPIEVAPHLYRPSAGVGNFPDQDALLESTLNATRVISPPIYLIIIVLTLPNSGLRALCPFAAGRKFPTESWDSDCLNMHRL